MDDLNPITPAPIETDSMADTELLDALVVVARACREGAWRWHDRALTDPSLSLPERLSINRCSERLERLREDTLGALAVISGSGFVKGAQMATERALRRVPEDPDAPAGRYS